MPILEIGQGELGENRSRLTLAYIERLMLWPDDENRRADAEAAVDAHLINETVQGFAGSGELSLVFPSDLAVVMGKVASAPRLRDIDARTQFLHGVAAGLVLHDMLGWAHLGSPNARMGYVVKSVAERLRISISTVQNTCWAQFRAVAHLWAATTGNALTAIDEGSRPDPFPTDLTLLPEFLAESEQYRALGEAFIPKQSGKGTMLKPDETWRMPSSISLPQVSLTFTRRAKLSKSI